MNRYLEVDQISVPQPCCTFTYMEVKFNLRTNQVSGRGRKTLQRKNCTDTGRVVFTFSSAF